MRPAQESLVRELRADAIVTDAHFFWFASLADELDVPCVQFYAIGAFSTIAMAHLIGAVKEGDKEVTIPRLPGHDLMIPTTELPEFLRSSSEVVVDYYKPKNVHSGPSAYFGVVVNTFLDLEAEYCEMYTRDKHAKRAYFVGPVSPPPLPASGESPCPGSGCLRDTMRFITERLVTKVLEIGERLWPEGAGVRSTKDEEKEIVPAKAVMDAVTKFMEPRGAGEAARSAIKQLAFKADTAIAKDGSSYRDLLRLIDDFMQAK
uniref:Uncharacterized protein n=1 Tax=Oryza punctata TaxID=4537 RepID=A0A0E0L4B6_ORYPU